MPTRRVLRCASKCSSSIPTDTVLRTALDAEPGVLCDEDSTPNTSWSGGIADVVEQVLEGSVHNVALADKEGSRGRWDHALGVYLLSLLSTRARFCHRRTFALDKAENRLFLPFVHEF